MKRVDVEAVFDRGDAVLLSGPVETRLAYEFGRPSPGHASFTQLFEPAGRAALTAIYSSYMLVAAEHDVPIVVDTPTWRAHPDALRRYGFHADGDLRYVNESAAALLLGLREDLGLQHLVMIAGVLGPRLDGYDPRGAPLPAEAQAYHQPQADLLADAGVDLLYAPTFPATDELEGVARACAATGLPYILAPVLRRDGCLLDGSAAKLAVARIDAAAQPAPLLFAGGCVHATDFRSAMQTTNWPQAPRIRGIAANGSALPRETLERLDHAESDDIATFAEQVSALRGFGLQLLGGCCGTDDAHLNALAGRLGTFGFSR